MNPFLWPTVKCLSGLLFITLLLAGCGEYENELAESKMYCDNVSLWKHTHGQYGNPAYRGEGECK